MPKFNLTKHKELWNWLAENPDMQKGHWPGWDEIEDWDDEIYPDNNCFACEYLVEGLLENERNNYCLCASTCEERCPLIWPSMGTCCDVDSLFRDWDNANDSKDYARAAELAKQIAELPVREGVETE